MSCCDEIIQEICNLINFTKWSQGNKSLVHSFNGYSLSGSDDKTCKDKRNSEFVYTWKNIVNNFWFVCTNLGLFVPVRIICTSLYMIVLNNVTNKNRADVLCYLFIILKIMVQVWLQWIHFLWIIFLLDVGTGWQT